jgi:multiple sugar transport system ATP-binding protein
MAELVLEGIDKVFPGGAEAVRDLDLTIEDGEFFILVGPSGCGKSTILNIIVGLEEPTSGRILVDGNDVTGQDPRDRNMAMVFQSYAIYPHMTVAENMAFPLKLAGMDEEETKERVRRAANVLELEELLDRKPAALSGGQRQRVAMGRAIVREPAAFLLDEPLSNLDAKLRNQMRTEIARLQRRLETTTVYVTHDQAEAMTLGDHIAVLRRGRLQQVGTPRDLYREPENLFVAGFIGSPSMNFLPARLAGDELRLPMTRISLPEEGLRDASRSEDGEFIAGIRPEHFRAAERTGSDAEGTYTEPGRGGKKRRAGGVGGPAPGTFRAPVELVEWMGAELYVHFQVSMEEAEGLEGAADSLRALSRDLELDEPEEGERRLVARLDPESRAAEGEALELTVDAGKVLLFDPETGRRMR